MLSSKISGFLDWFSFEDALRKVPPKIGVYIIRMKNEIRVGRVKGTSDIVYIGSTEKDFRSRFRGYKKPGPTQVTNKRIQEFSNKYKLEVSYRVVDNPRELENKLLTAYEKDHDELPPMNQSNVNKNP